MFGLTGTGYFDLVAYEKFNNGEMSDYIPTDAELENGENWELVNSATESGKQYIAHKTIPIAQIKSLG